MATSDSHRNSVPDEELVAEFVSAFVGGDADGIAELVTEDCVLHQPRWPLDTEGREAIVEKTRDLEGTFTDFDVDVEQSVIADDRIAVYMTASGRNVGPIRGDGREIAPTGRTFEIPQFGIYHIEDGRIAEAWILADALGLVEQLGNFPAGPGKLLRIVLRQLRWRLGGRKTLQ